MAKRKKRAEYVAYFYFVEGKDGKDRSVGYSASLPLLKKELEQELEAQEPGVEKGADPEEQSLLEVSEGALADEMKKALETGLSQRHLILIAHAMGNVSAASMVASSITGQFGDEENCVEKSDEYAIYGLTDDRNFGFQKTIQNFEEIERGMAALPSAALMSLVATFDSFTVDVVKKMLKLRPERLTDSEKPMLIKDIIKMRSFESLIDAVIEEETYIFSRGSHEDQVRFIETNFHIPIIKTWPRWPDFIEVFERRNLVAHGEKAFNARYIDICKRAGADLSDQLGKPVKLPEEYLSNAADILLEFSILLTFVLWRKHFDKDEEKAFESLNEVSFQLISNGRHVVAMHVLEFALTIKNSKMPEVIRRMMIVNLASAHKHSGSDERCAEILEGEDWSASADNYRICVAALREDVDQVIELMEPVVRSATVMKSSFRTWPVFKFVRKDEKFQTAFEQFFGEPLQQSRKAAGEPENKPPEDGPPSTRH